jgi:cobalt-zinc-cadmium efflux system protein
MGAGHSHGHVHGLPAAGNEGRLWMVLALTASFLAVEVIAALVTGSLALLSDAAHMFTDVAALGVALVAMRIGRRAADRKRTFGYRRFEILAAAYNASILFAVAIYILYEAIARLRAPIVIATTPMLVVAALGFVVNGIGMLLLRRGSEDNLNMKGAYLEVWSDMLGSLGVIVAALLVHFTGRHWIDSVAAIGIGLWVLPRTWALLKESVNVLLQGAPGHIDMDALEKSILGVQGVEAVHDLHVWSLTSGHDVLSVHVVLDVAQKTERELLAQIEAVVRAAGIHHSTIQIEAQSCRSGEPHAHGHDHGHDEGGDHSH